jgi:hypothetical protein
VYHVLSGVKAASTFHLLRRSSAPNIVSAVLRNSAITKMSDPVGSLSMVYLWYSNNHVVFR